MRSQQDRRAAHDHARRILSVFSGAILVSVFLVWLVVRNHEAVRAVLGLDTGAGWISHALAVAVLLGGLALLARGSFGRTGMRTGDTRDTGETPP